MQRLNFISDEQHNGLIHTTKKSDPDPFSRTESPAPDSSFDLYSGDTDEDAEGVKSNASKVVPNTKGEEYVSKFQETNLPSSLFEPEKQVASGLLIPGESGGEPTPEASQVTIIDSETVPTMDGGEILKEVLISNMVQTNRFEVLSPAAFSTTGQAGVPQKEELKSKGVDYLLFAEITDFEVKKDVEYWKVPLWALLLIAAFVVKDDDTRAFILHTLLRLAIYLPSDSKFWELGLGTEDLELRISASVNLRLVDPYTGSVVYADQQSLDRLESVNNMDLIVWRSENSLQIKESTAGRQLRFLTANMVNDLVQRMTPESAIPKEEPARIEE
tara:strand:- start:54958 stop:55947 length:990 start_codon:yes stop_codon:yes gene_type:complete